MMLKRRLPPRHGLRLKHYDYELIFFLSPPTGTQKRKRRHAYGNHHIDFIVVLGEPPYYSRFGFKRARASFGLRSGYGCGPAFQALELKTNSLKKIWGALIGYAPEFFELDV